MVVRADLSPGLAAAQAVHAALQFASQHPSITGPWHRDSQYLIIVTVPDEISLIALASRALERDIEVSTWHEPDLAGEATAVALQPGKVAQRLCCALPLHGKGFRLVA
ncbi:MAG: hypothetical protein NVS3B1_17840 [Marmoricola sp.]